VKGLFLALGFSLVVGGIAGLAYCIWAGAALRRRPPSPDEMRGRLTTLVAINLGAVSSAALGLGFLVLGFTL
jgi:hypothetical protein